MRNKLILFLITSILFLSACKSREKVVYMQSDDTEWGVIDTANYCITIKPGDQLNIIVMSQRPELAAPFNMQAFPTPYSASSGTQLQISSYGGSPHVFDVDPDGVIFYPYLGAFRIAGMNKYQVQDSIQSFLRNNGFVNDAMVNVTITNLKYTVLGEVKSPGLKTFSGDRFTIINALASVSDMTEYGERYNVKLVRHEGNTAKVKLIDFRDPDLLTSPYYYVEQNDIIYVEPNHAKAHNRDMSTLNSFSVTITNLMLRITNLLISL